MREHWQALLDGEHAGTLLITPFEILARQQGFTLLGNAIEVLDHYQGVVGATRKSWALVHRDELVGFIRAYINALHWLYQPANREDALNMLVRNTHLSPTLLREAYEILSNPVDGFAPTARVDIAGVQSVLALRNHYATSLMNLSEHTKYLDLEHYEHALSSDL